MATVAVGGATAFTGRLTADGLGVSGVLVRLQTRALRATAWSDVAGRTATTGATGGYRIAGVAPAATADFRVVFGGDSGAGAAQSAVRRVKVRGTVGLHTLVSTVKEGRKVTYSGTLAPKHTGARVTVTVRRPGHRTRTVEARVDSRGHWSVRTNAPHDAGRWTVVARWGGDFDHLGDASPARVLRVVRR
ncbi:MAG: hypothetical protein HOQ22_08470 [Nocardioidaceae bacterium]|nr:hypothetical protein [Nocardioidaceae bacterium]